MSVPDASWHDPVLGADLHTGSEAVVWGQRFTGGMLATDIETPGLATFTINCVTMAWEESGQLHAVLLDPRRDGRHMSLIWDMYARADRLVLHNAAFDVPILWHNGLIDACGINKITDTLVLARLAYPDEYISKTLTAMVGKHLGWTDFAKGMDLAFHAAGYKTKEAGYRGMDIDSPIYRLGAMADTVATLRLEPLLRDTARHWLTDHPFEVVGARTSTEADAVIAMPETVHRVMLRRSARGLAVDLAHLDRYGESVEADRAQAALQLEKVDLTGGKGKATKIIEHLAEVGELPEDWPRTPTGKLKATKALLDTLDHPLAEAQRVLASTDKVTDWLTNVSVQAEITGRCHPQVGVLGASQTGRMSYSNPAMQQFSAPARGIITDDGQGLTSIDFAQIEPVTMALMAHDTEFLAPFEAGADLYEPIQRAAGITRPMAKVMLLALMYGQGVNSLARQIKHTTESASQLRRQTLAAMPRCAEWMAQVTWAGETHERVITVGGRILPAQRDFAYRSTNHVVQGSAADVLYDTIVRMEAAGLGDHLQLAVHDELVVDTEVADEVQHVMETPPEFLTRWADRTTRLRTDRKDLGHNWAKA